MAIESELLEEIAGLNIDLCNEKNGNNRLKRLLTARLATVKVANNRGNKQAVVDRLLTDIISELDNGAF